ncbi:hypothetical protein DR864_16980 [Runella rosea]|uniref:Uncharacterized protein n=1 Tax=Runella rosea TaxID=2259595 RepID=A0A344TL00_9BACT|nr:DUF6000 family protein [Runella rosea]AXE19321.1 hypothetical protein DR864_16980 [Runella rosea]
MDSKELEQLKLHVAGAVVRHTSPFNELNSFNNEFELNQEFVDRWVIPFYTNIRKTESSWVNKLLAIKCEINDDIILKTLGDFNWRTRQTGAFFSAITNKNQFIDIIGIHLLKSEVCFAGRIYCYVLASFNTTKCVDYLNLYLEYYLTKPNLWFNQREAMEAILYLDSLNQTCYFENHLNNWSQFIINKPDWEKEIKTEKLEEWLSVIEKVKSHNC